MKKLIFGAILGLASLSSSAAIISADATLTVHNPAGAWGPTMLVHFVATGDPNGTLTSLDEFSVTSGGAYIGLQAVERIGGSGGHWIFLSNGNAYGPAFGADITSTRLEFNFTDPSGRASWNGDFYQRYVDGVADPAPVPVPASAALVALGLAAMFRQKKSNFIPA